MKARIKVTNARAYNEVEINRHKRRRVQTSTRTSHVIADGARELS